MLSLKELADILILRAQGLDAYALQKDQREGRVTCVDCGHFRPPEAPWDWAGCVHPEHLTWEPVWGQTPGRCVAQRMREKDNLCGPKAKRLTPSGRYIQHEVGVAQAISAYINSNALMQVGELRSGEALEAMWERVEAAGVECGDLREQVEGELEGVED